MFEHLEVGSKVVRLLGGVLPMQMVVSSVTDKVITCQPVGTTIDYTFDRNLGYEIDEDLGWPRIVGKTITSGSYLKPEVVNEVA